MNLPRMRTLPEAITEIRTLDPSTAFTMRALRGLVLSGAIPHVQVGAKRLVNLDTLLDYLVAPQSTRSPAPGPGVIRPIPERLAGRRDA